MLNRAQYRIFSENWVSEPAKKKKIHKMGNNPPNFSLAMIR